ncbi:MAG: darcynin [Caulobacteraceae bacterium]|nr:darcynin [Caulobacteraceae bacterium]
MKTTIFMLLNALPQWLSLDRAARRAFHAQSLAPILNAHPQTRLRYYDAEAFSGRCSDIAVFETENLLDYSDLIEDLRDTAFFGAPYYQVVDIIPAIEEGYLDYDARMAAEPATAT